MKLNAFMAVLVAIASGCAAGPENWATDAEMRVRCGMTVDQVSRITGRAIEKADVVDHRRTHFIREGDTDLWLVFTDRGLQSVQVAWAYQPTRTASSQRLELCSNVNAR